LHPDPADLSAVPVFASLAVDDLRRIAGWLEVRRADPGERLVREGASGYSFYVLLEGTAVVTSDGVELRTLAAGDFFGELALTGEGRRTASVTATSPVTVASMFGSNFRLLEQELPTAAERILGAAAERAG
jgi:CRP-like cAMP-binding protein